MLASLSLRTGLGNGMKQMNRRVTPRLAATLMLARDGEDGLGTVHGASFFIDRAARNSTHCRPSKVVNRSLVE
jgi:hypothetical protein